MHTGAVCLISQSDARFHERYLGYGQLDLPLQSLPLLRALLLLLLLRLLLLLN